MFFCWHMELSLPDIGCVLLWISLYLMSVWVCNDTGYGSDVAAGVITVSV